MNINIIHDVYGSAGDSYCWPLGRSAHTTPVKSSDILVADMKTETKMINQL